MRYTNIRILLPLLLCLVWSCSPRLAYKSYNFAAIQKTYAESVGDAAKPQPWEITQSLSAVNNSNDKLIRKEIKGEEYLLVSSWKSDTTYYFNDPTTGFYHTGNYPIWVTLAPELQELCQQPSFGRREGLDLRLKQLLGLPPDANNQYFIEFWVRPADLFRPCPDPEVTDNTCGLAFPEDVTPEHQAWINDLRLASYYNPAWQRNYPWTELGYTYDWNKRNKTKIGLSEFVIQLNSNIIVHRVRSTVSYCATRR